MPFTPHNRRDKMSRKKIIARYAIVLLIFTLVLPVLGGCGDHVQVDVKATLNGRNWSGPINATINVPDAVVQGAAHRAGKEGLREINSVSWIDSGLPGGTYEFTYISGGPEGADVSFSGISYHFATGMDTPDDGFVETASVQLTVSESDVFSVTFNFVTPGKIGVNATLDGQPWEGTADYEIQGPVEVTCPPKTIPDIIS